MNPDKYIFTDEVTKTLSRSIDVPRTKTVLDTLIKWIDMNITYASDVKNYGFDYIQSPSVTTRYGKGDCQDITALVSSVLNMLNIPYKLVEGFLKTNKSYRHIWLEVKGKDSIYVVDGTVPDYFPLDSRNDRVAMKKSEWI